jgi:hypothetical protein
MQRLSFLLVFLALLPASLAGAELGTMKAPSLLYPEPNSFFLLALQGDYATIRYTPGSLDRAANLQTRLELASRTFDRAVKRELELTVYMLSREEWVNSRYDIEYGLPLRVGRHSLAVPAFGDPGTVQLWSGMLAGSLPQVKGLPLRGTAHEAATMILADLFCQLLTAEILVDDIGIAGDAYWVRGLMTHLASVDASRRHDPRRLEDLDAMYGRLASSHQGRPLAARDYGPELTLDDWLWFQASLHRGARILLQEEGKGALKKMKKITKHDGGVLRGETLLRKYDPLEEWYRETFSGVSFR